ncbi:hypothetical protein J6590_100741, partial [Homalodisca vitripennis]
NLDYPGWQTPMVYVEKVPGNDAEQGALDKFYCLGVFYLLLHFFAALHRFLPPPNSSFTP